MTPKRNKDEDEHDPHPKKQTKTNVGKHWPNILQNTQKYPKNTPKCPKNIQNERKKRKKQRKIVQIWTNVNINDATRPGSKTNVNVIDATQPGSKTNVNVIDATGPSSKTNTDDVEEALKFFGRTKTKTKKPLNFLDERSHRLPNLCQRRHL